jgi:hypothetical protein
VDASFEGPGLKLTRCRPRMCSATGSPVADEERGVLPCAVANGLLCSFARQLEKVGLQPQSVTIIVIVVVIISVPQVSNTFQNAKNAPT